MKYRKTRKQKRKQRKILIGICFSLLLCMTIGYAAFNTQLSLKAKGNIVPKSAADILKDNVVTSGDGLYEDIYEEGKYIYRGSNPSNYIIFNDETWRIMSVENDETIKIVRNESIGDQIWNSSLSCDVIAKSDSKSNIKDGTIYTENKNIIFISSIPNSNQEKLPPGGCNEWSQPADLNTYLNTTYYNDILSDVSKNQITQSWFNVGPVSEDNNYTLNDNIEQSKAARWQGNIGLIDAVEYVKASTNSSCGSVYDFVSNSSCYNNSQNYLNIPNNFWMLSPSSTLYSNSYYVFYLFSSGSLYYSNSYNSYGVRPTLYLKSDITLSGEGTETNPYVIS